MHYTVKGSINNKIADRSFRLILKAIIIDELRQIKFKMSANDGITRNFGYKDFLVWFPHCTQLIIPAHSNEI